MTDPAAPPTCYRHPDRETYIGCSRCERHVCPDCRVDAAVGFQCRECLRAGNRGRREWRTRFGGRTVEDTARVTKVLIALNVAVYVLQWAVPPLTTALAQVGAATDALGRPVGIAYGEPYRLVTAGFLHSPGWPLHLLLNMAALWSLGPAVEEQLGRIRFVALYLLALLGGSALSYAVGSPAESSVGASGAIFGLFAANVIVGRRLGRDVTGLYVVLGVLIVLGFVDPMIDWQAHLGGLAAGAAAAAALVHAPAARRTAVQVAGCLAVLAVVVAVVLVRTARLGGFA